MTVPVAAHQRKIAEKARKASKRERLSSLDGAEVRIIKREEAEPIILEFEWLGDIGHAHKFVGLFVPDDLLGEELIGVACFGHGPAPEDMRTLLGGSALCLERGACVPHAPPNAASFLISKACKLISEQSEPKVVLFFAYGDPDAGEYGAVYQAANWIYLGQGLMGRDAKTGTLKRRTERWKVLAKGGNPNNQREWKTTRELRRAGRNLKREEAEALGWTFKKFPAKHVYAVNVGPNAKLWRKTMGRKFGLPFPKPRPGLSLTKSGKAS